MLELPLSRRTWKFRFLLVPVMPLLAAVGSGRAQDEMFQAGKRIGTPSCAARGCHGSIAAVNPLKGDVYIKDGEYSTWRGFDPHSKAHAVLLEPRSQRIARLLSSQLGGKPAHEADLCLKCHSIDPGHARLPEASNRDGVDCEACHGPAEKWVDAHVSESWLSKTSEAKRELGFVNTKDLVERGNRCVGCHVGTPDREVNHDLIAAGHPRLNFEYSSHLGFLPKHWKEPHEKAQAAPQADRKDFQARVWAVGQLLSTSASLELLRSRAASASKGTGGSPWPEFTETGCFACHHELAVPSDRLQGKLADLDAKRPISPPFGNLPWGTWYVPMTRVLLQEMGEGSTVGADSSLEKLRVEMSLLDPDATKVERLAAETLAGLKNKAESINRDGFTIEKIRSTRSAVMKTAATDQGEDWDHAAQRYLAALALDRASADLEGRPRESSPELEALGSYLKFPEGIDSPRGRPRSLDRAAGNRGGR